MAGHPGQQRRPWQSHIDMYRKIPMDLMEGTRRGSILSYLSLILMIVLFIWETKAYFTTKLVTDLALDYKRDMANTMTTTAEDMGIGQASNYKDNIRLNFNITMTDLSCDYAVIDVVSVLGTDQNVTAHVTKWNIDGNGVRKGYKGRNRNQKDIDLFDINIKETLEELHEDGEDAVTLTPELFEEYKKNYDYVFVDFFASWCSHCKDLAPTWEALAEVMTESSINVVEGQQEEETKDNGGQEHNYSEEDFQHAVSVNIPVIIGKVDCVDHKFLCNQEEQIRAYPTLRLFIDGKTLPGGSDYKGHRTVMDVSFYTDFVLFSSLSFNFVPYRLISFHSISFHSIREFSSLRSY
jgi:thiol-disulfide isomerase/thioredoxin